jgi:hypothetical protein
MAERKKSIGWVMRKMVENNAKASRYIQMIRSSVIFRPSQLMSPDMMKKYAITDAAGALVIRGRNFDAALLRYYLKVPDCKDFDFYLVQRNVRKSHYLKIFHCRHVVNNQGHETECGRTYTNC